MRARLRSARRRPVLPRLVSASSLPSPWSGPVVRPRQRSIGARCCRPESCGRTNPLGDVLHVVLFRPEIPPNTGNVIRLCANAGAHLHLIEPLGFAVDHAKLRRAGLDYHEFANLSVHANLEAFRGAVSPARLFVFTTEGRMRHDEVAWRAGDAMLFGPESASLSDAELATIPADDLVRLPMRPGSRSLNLSNAVAIAVYEAWRQQGFEGSC